MSLPEPYATWFEEVVGVPAPDEPLATCDRCPLCAEGVLRPSVKCCGYAPTLPNFRAGEALLAGGSAAELVTRRIREGRPSDSFLHPSADEEAVYDQEGQLGATEAGRCPYLDGEGCGIWAYRNATCATWFCRHQHGPAGAALWQAADDLFRFAEGGVAVWAADADYEVAARRARSLDWAAIRRLGGVELRTLEDTLRAAARGVGLIR